MGSVPALLVSVRNRNEALAAIAGGCDLLDVKEPTRGPLGMADPAVIDEVAALSQIAGDVDLPRPCSVALDEIARWQKEGRCFSLPRGVTYAKLGPAKLRTPQRWLDGWRVAKDCFPAPQADRIHWIAVAYADWNAADALPPAVILECAIEAGCDGFLIDTQQKDGGSLLDWLSVAELAQIADRARRAEIPLALAGSLGLDDLSIVINIRPDIIAVRGAACAGRDRLGAVSPECVRGLKEAIGGLFGSPRSDRKLAASDAK